MRKLWKFLSFLILAMVLLVVFSIFPSPSPEQVKNEIGGFLYRYTVKKVETWDIPDPQIVIWYPVVQKEIEPEGEWYVEHHQIRDWEFDNEPIKVWWYEDGIWSEIKGDKRQAIDLYNEITQDRWIQGYYWFGIISVEKSGWWYKASVSQNEYHAPLAGRGFDSKILRGPFGIWWIITDIFDGWIS